MKPIPSLMELLANPLSQQAGKWLVIRRRPESSNNKRLRSRQKTVVPLRGDFLINWIPACAGMTVTL